MKESNTAQRLQMVMRERGLKQVDILRAAEPFCKKYNVKLGRNDLSQYVSGKVEPGQYKLTILGLALNVSEAWLMGYDVPMERNANKKFPGIDITEDYVTFPVIGEIAAGYDKIAVEDWTGEAVDIPRSYLKGRSIDDFLVLSVIGNSMYPLYLHGDKVLILRQQSVDSGAIAAVLYDDDKATIKKVEYANGEDWLRLVPLNLEYEPKTIVGEELQRCRIIGIPKLLLREY